MPLAYLEILAELFVDLSDFVVLGDDEVDLGAGLFHQPIEPSAVGLAVLPLLAQRPPFLLLRRQLLHLLPDLVLHLPLLQLLGGNVVLQLLAILLFVRDLTLVDRDGSV